MWSFAVRPVDPRERENGVYDRAGACPLAHMERVRDRAGHGAIRSGLCHFSQGIVLVPVRGA